MIDIHCHILPDIDDGPATIEESLEMARQAYEDGIRTIVATPHIKHDLLSEDLISERRELFKGKLAEMGIGLEILSGADVNASIDPAFLSDYTVNGTDYLIIEFPHSHLPHDAEAILFRLQAAGLKPIVSHPERNSTVTSNPGLLLALLNEHTYVQITAGSLTGEFGPEVRECAQYLLSKGVIDFIASDGHSSKARRPLLSAGVAEAARVIGQQEALMMVTSNPRAVIEGRALNE